jgi:hypothetical protein
LSRHPLERLWVNLQKRRCFPGVQYLLKGLRDELGLMRIRFMVWFCKMAHLYFSSSVSSVAPSLNSALFPRSSVATKFDDGGADDD